MLLPFSDRFYILATCPVFGERLRGHIFLLGYYQSFTKKIEELLLLYYNQLENNHPCPRAKSIMQDAIVCVRAWSTTKCREIQQGTPEHTMFHGLVELCDASVRRVNNLLSPLTTASDATLPILARIDDNTRATLQHARGIPLLKAELNEARKNPEGVALEIVSRLQDILDPAQHVIWRAMQDAGGVQTHALGELKRKGSVKNKTALCRQVKVINKILVANDLPKCNAPESMGKYKKTRSYEDKTGAIKGGDVYLDEDWAKDPVNRERIIKQFLAASDNEKECFRKNYSAIEDELKEYQKSH